jgi:hypothetical protein
MISFASHFNTGVGGHKVFEMISFPSHSSGGVGGPVGGWEDTRFSKYFHFQVTPRGRWEGEGCSIKISILLTSFKYLISPGRGVGTREGAWFLNRCYVLRYILLVYGSTVPEISNVCRYGTWQHCQKCRRSRGYRVVCILG